MLRGCSHDWAACCKDLNNSGEFECVLCIVVTKCLESSTNTDIYIIPFIVVLWIGANLLQCPDPWIGYCL